MESSSVATALIALRGAFTAVGALTALHFARRMPPAQRFQMGRTLRRQVLENRQRAAAFATSHFKREAAVEAITSHLSASSSLGPLVVSGAEGTGTSSAVISAIARADPPLLLRFNLRAYAKGAQSNRLFDACGYYTTPRDLADTGLVRRWQFRDEYDLDQCLTHLADIFRRKREAAPMPLPQIFGAPAAPRRPVLFIDELHDTVDQAGELFEKLLRYGLFLSEAQLAHVVIVARPHAASSLDEGSSTFRAVRRRLIVGFPHDDDVVDYLQTPAGGGLPATDAQRVARALGGQLKDVRAVADAARRGGDGETPAWERTLAALLADSEEAVVRQWEALADAGNATELPRGQRVALYKRALRFWAMAETLSARRDMPRRELAASVFAPTGGAAAAEIEENIALGLLAYVPLGRCGGAGAEDDRDIGIAAASPRLRAAFGTLTADARCKAYRDKLSGELAKLEQQQRMAQLSERRLELAAERRGTASALAATPAEDGALRAALLKAAAAGEAEREEITAELKRVRDEFDALKWKGRWSG